MVKTISVAAPSLRVQFQPRQVASQFPQSSAGKLPQGFFASEVDGHQNFDGNAAAVMAEIVVNGNAMNSEIKRIPVVIGWKP